MLKLKLCALVLAVLYCTSASGKTIITVAPDSSECSHTDPGLCSMNISMGLEMLASSDDLQLSLLSGKHIVSQFIFVANRSGIGIVGVQDGDVVLHCTENIGIAFFNMTNLTFANITVVGCALSGERLSAVISAYYDIFDEVYSFPEELRIAISLVHCSDVTLDRVTINGTRGIGLLGLNIIGSSRITRSHFLNNRPPECDVSTFTPSGRYLHYIGGGLYLYYQDYENSLDGNFGSDNQLVISDSTFVNNSDCSTIIGVELYMEFSLALQEAGYFISGGGGLTVVLAQLNFGVRIGVETSSFRQNQAKAGGAVHIGMFSAVTQCSVDFNNCVFEQNNGILRPPYIGGAVFACIELGRPNGTFNYPTAAERNISLRFIDSNFTQNSAYVAGAIYVYSIYTNTLSSNILNIQIQRCVFEENKALAASGLFIGERKFGGFNNGVVVAMEDTKIRGNQIATSADVFAFQVTFRVALSIQSVQLTLRGNNVFSANKGTALGSVRSTIYAFDNSEFSLNEGELGGAMSLIDYSFLIVQRNASILFANNTGVVAGGAIYVNFIVNGFSFTYDDCFLYFERLNGLFCTNTSCSRVEDLNINITFTGNRALSGGIVYGSTLKTCAWVVGLSDITPERNVYRYFHRKKLVMYFDEEPDGPRLLSTSSFSLGANTNFLAGTVMPGQKFTVPIKVFDRYNHSVPEGLTSQIGTNRNLIADLAQRSVLGASGYWFLDGTNETINVPLTIRAQENESVDVTLLSTSSVSTAEGTFSLAITPCIKGFLFNDSTLSCYCDPRLSETGVTCDIDQRGLVSPLNTWVGPIDANADDKLNKGFVVNRCILNYCNFNRMLITNGDFDSQCTNGFNKSGFMCGGCMENSSAVFGTNRCRECSHYYLLLIIVFILLGVLLMGAMFFFQITITEGYLNSVVFFANVVSLLTTLVGRTSVRYVYLPLSLLSLNLGVEVCFFDGMTRIATVGLHMVFIAYLFALMGISTLLVRRIKLRQPLAYSPAKVFATLIVLCYISLLHICIRIFAFLRVTTFSGEVHYRWYEDPTVPYFQGVHAIYCVLATVILLFYLIPVPLLSFFPKYLYRFKLTSKLKPVYDAFWAPFKPKYRWWLGFRLYFRWVPFALSAFVPVPDSIFYLSVVMPLLLLLQAKLQPFQGYWNNLLDDMFMTVMLLILYGALYFFFGIRGNISTVYLVILVIVVYGLLITVFVIHLFLRFPRLKSFILELPSRMKKVQSDETAVSTSSPTAVKPQTLPIPSIQVVLSTGPSSPASPPGQTPTDQLLPGDVRLVSFTELREPLLEDCGEAEVTVSQRFSQSSTQSFNLSREHATNNSI